MHGVNLWEVDSLHCWIFFESIIHHLEITLTWSPLYCRKEEVLVIQCDNNR